MTTTINNEHKKLNVPNSTDKGNVIRNVPHLRFPEFEGEWEKCKFKDVCSISTGNKNTQDKADDGIYPFYVRSQTVERINSWTFDGEAILTAGDGVGVGKVFHHSYGKIGVHQRVYILSDFKCDANYLFHFFSSKFYNRVKRMSAKNSVDSVRKEMITDMPLSLPCHKEQVKIGHMLSLLDERIATQSKIIEDLKKLKSAISHILFSSKGAIHLSEIANVVMGQSPSSNAYNDQGLGMPLVQGNLDISNGKTTPRLYTAEFNQTTEKGNIILTVRAPVGEVAKATQKVCLGRGVCAIIPHEENMSDFIYQYLTFYKFMWRRYEQGSTFTSINGSDVRNIFCPKVRNVSILTLLDIKINIEERVVKQYQSQKQYMLYQMFI